MSEKPVANLMPAMYSHRLHDIQTYARECGYAIAVHGSMQRDLDLIAVPWTEQACSAAELAVYLCHCMNLTQADNPSVRHHRRVVYTLLMGGSLFVDLSVVEPDSKWPAEDGRSE